MVPHCTAQSLEMNDREDLLTAPEGKDSAFFGRRGIKLEPDLNLVLACLSYDLQDRVRLLSISVVKLLRLLTIDIHNH